jgi:hypothetical protein
MPNDLEGTKPATVATMRALPRAGSGDEDVMGAMAKYTMSTLIHHDANP